MRVTMVGFCFLCVLKCKCGHAAVGEGIVG